MQSLSKPKPPNWRNQIVGHWFTFCVWPWTAQSEFRMKWDTCGSPQVGFSFTVPTQLPWRHHTAAISKHAPGLTAYFDSGKRKVRNLSGLLFILNWSDQQRESEGRGAVLCLSLLPVDRQFNRKQIPLTHKYPQYAAEQSSSQFYRSLYRKH